MHIMGIQAEVELDGRRLTSRNPPRASLLTTRRTPHRQRRTLGGD
jgi:hypothetical protein